MWLSDIEVDFVQQMICARQQCLSNCLTGVSVFSEVFVMTDMQAKFQHKNELKCILQFIVLAMQFCAD